MKPEKLQKKALLFLFASSSKQRLSALIALVLAACLYVQEHQRAPSVPPGLYYVERVIDGDTLHVRNTQGEEDKVRMVWIDAPESQQLAGQEATEALAQKISAQNVRIDNFGKDRYGRMLGQVWIHGEDINLWMVSSGWAWYYTSYNQQQSKKDQERYRIAQKKAQEQALGLWAYPSAIAPWLWRKKKSK